MTASAKSLVTAITSESETDSKSGMLYPTTKYQTPAEWLKSDEWAQYSANPDNDYYKVNAQQMAKNPILLDCLVPEEGDVFVQLDYTSLEPYVLAEFSGCPTYKEVYASGKPHDVYLFVVCRLLDPDGKMSAVYHPDNPTKETVKATKKQFKAERGVGKVFQLMSTYKAGAPKIHRKLKLLGYNYTKQQVKEIREEYWGPKLFGSIIDYENDLLEQVKQNDGFFFNGTGRPLVVTTRKEKDVVNTFCQSSGHDYLDMMVAEFEKLYPSAKPVVEDYHDETVWSVPEDQAEAALAALREAVTIVNDRINFKTPLVGEPEVAHLFTDFKQPDAVDWYTEKCNQ